MATRSSFQTWFEGLQIRPQQRKKYKYQRLPNKSSIRILELLPGVGREDISCRLVDTDLKNAENNYIALSYAWGDPKTRNGIVCDGTRVDITASLAGALYAVRDPTKPKKMWADAICINQDDDMEKGQQVAIMDKVYEYATEVVVWLGPDDECVAKDCFDLIRQTNKYLDALLEKHDHYAQIPTIDRRAISFDQKRWNNVGRLISLQWFQRIWVIQEAALAKKCELLWGEQRMDIAELCEISLWLSVKTELTMTAGTGTFGGMFLFGHCTYRNPETWRTSLPLIKYHQDMVDLYGWSLSHVLDSARDLQATYNTDRVYAFLGNPLARKVSSGEDGVELIIQPDYSKGEDEVYFETAAALLKDPRSAAYVLPFVSHASEADVEGKTLPSWVPRWDRVRLDCTLNVPNYWYQAGGAGRRFEARVQEDKSFVARGLIFDRLHWTSDTVMRHNLSLDSDRWDERFRSARKPFIDCLWESLVVSSRSPSDGSEARCLPELEIAFARTLARGYATEQREPEFDSGRAVHFDAYRHAVRYEANPVRGRAPWDMNTTHGEAHHFVHEINYAHYQRLCWTPSGHLGLVPVLARPGDACCIFPGMQTPLVLRPRGHNRYNLVGEAYIDGVMGGEVVEKLNQGTVIEEEIVIV